MTRKLVLGKLLGQGIDAPTGRWLGGLSILPLLLCVVTLIACGGGGGGGGQEPADAAATVDVGAADLGAPDAAGADSGGPTSVGPEIEVDTGALTLVADVGQDSAAVNVVVNNFGTSTLTVRGAAFDPADGPFRLDGAPVWPAAVAPGERLTLAVVYRAADADSAAGTLTITSDDADEGSIAVPLSGRTPKHCMDILPRALELGAVELGVPSGRFEVTIRNCGDGTVTLPNVLIDGDAHFHVAKDNQEGPLHGLTIDANRSIRVDVWYVNEDLTDGAEATAKLHVDTDDAENPVLETMLHVRGSQAPRCLPTFDPDRLDFGPLRIGTTHDLPVTVTNSGTGACLVSAIHVTAQDGDPANTFTVGGSDAGADRLEAGASLSLVVTFVPTVRDQQGARSKLEFLYQEEGSDVNRRQSIFLFGVAAIAEVGVAAENVRFENTVANDCASPTHPVSATNVGLVPLCLTDVRLQGDECGAFTLVDGPALGDCISIEASGDATWHYQYQPTRVGSQTCDLVITDDAMNTDTVQIRMTGTGVDTAHQDDDFVMGDVPAGQRAYFTLSRPALSPDMAVDVGGAPVDSWHFSAMRNAIYFEVADRPARDAHVTAHYETDCLHRL